jgi:glycosyltransferase involved in cell wall biosynthesis
VALSKRPGVEVAALQPAYIDLGEYGTTRTTPDPGLPYLLRPAPVLPRRPYPYSLYLRGVAPLLREFRPDIIYSIGEPSELGVAQIMRTAGRVVPEARRLVYSLENVERDWSGFPRTLRRMAERATLPRLDFAIAASQSAADQLVRQGFPRERIRVVYAGFDPTNFSRRDASAVRAELGAQDAFVVGFAGRVVQEKGVDLLVRALARLPGRFLLAIVGTGNAEPELRALAAELGVAERVRWLGRVAYTQMPTYLSAFDVLALPSRSIPVWQEQFGRALVEAMFCETPLLGSSSGAIPEIIGDAGLVFPEGDVEALARRINELDADRELARQLGGNGLRRAHAHFTEEVQAQRLMEAFGEALAMPKRRTASAK